MSTNQITKLNLQSHCSNLPYMARQANLAPYDKTEVGRRIATLRAARQGMLQKTLAEAIGINPQKLNNYEKGRDLIPVDHAAQVCTITGANFDYLYRGLMGSLPPDLAAAILEAGKSPSPKVSRRA